MLDIFYCTIVFIFFAAAIFYVRALDKLHGGDHE